MTTSSVSTLADHKTAFVRDEWYVAALSDEIGQQLSSRQILGITILMYRDEHGKAVAMRNRCPHRSFPLSRGHLEGSNVVCGYHGLAFGPDGHCLSVPSQEKVPNGLKTRSYPLIEKAPFLWIWMGEPSHADTAMIPDHPWLRSPDYASFVGYIHCRSSYVRLHENVLDLTHFPYVHGEGVGGLDYIRAPAEVKKEDDMVVIRRSLKNRRRNAAYARMIGNEGNLVDRTSESWFKSPGFHVAHAVIEDLEGGIGGRHIFNFKIVHCFTPETPHSTHYFYGNARDVAIDDAHLTSESEALTRAVFMEDEEALELVEQSWIEEDECDYRENSIRGDLAGLHMRRIIARRAAQQLT